MLEKTDLFSHLKKIRVMVVTHNQESNTQKKFENIHYGL